MGVESVDRLIRRHVLALEDLKGERAAEFLKQLETARNTIEVKIATTPGVSLDAFRLRGLLQEVDAALVVLKSRATGTLVDGEKTAVEMSLEHTARELTDMSRTFGDPLAISLDAAQALSDPVRGLLANQFESSVAKYGIDLLNKTRAHLIQGVLTGESPQSMAARVANERTGPFGQVARSDADHLVRTEVSHAYGVASQGAIKQAKKKLGGDLQKTWIHVGSYPCPICTKLNGTVREVEGSWTYKSGSRSYTIAGPPAHPNCVCRALATKKSWRSKLSQLGYLDEGHRIAS